MAYIKKNLFTILGIVAGSVLGYIYWHQIGCSSGTCAITSSPVNSTLYGALMGGLLLNIFQKKEKKEANSDEQ